MIFRAARGLPRVPLIAQHGRHGNMTKWVGDLKGDCPERDAAQMHDCCDLICPDLPSVL
jgi:hypothetical protein